jgi:phosphate-selective porin OprO/OprP
MLIASRNDSYRVKIHGYLQGDGLFFVSNIKDQQKEVFLFRRVRPLVEGTLANRMDFRFMPDFGEGKTVIQESYVEWKSIPYAKLRVGKFKTPIGLEVLREDRKLTFAERSMVSDLIPLRDIGGQVGGSLSGDAITYEVGYFSGTEDGANANFEWAGTNEGVARVYFEPFIARTSSAAQGLGFGVAASAGYSHGPLPSFATVTRETIFEYSSSAISDGQHKRLLPQADYFYGSFGLLAEYAFSGEMAQVGAKRHYLSNNGWQLAGSIVLTGEKNSYAGVQPAHAFEFGHGRQHLGAWEIAARQSRLNFDANAFPQYANPASSARGAIESAVGLNWYINREVKLVTDYEYTTFCMATVNTPHLPSERVVMTRIQLAF